MSRIIRSGNVAVGRDSRTIFEIKPMATDTTNPRDLVSDPTLPSTFLESPYYNDFFFAGDDLVIPDGPDNIFPYRWKQLIEQDSIAPGMLRQRIDLLLAGKVKLFIEKQEGKLIIEEQILNNEITDWLDSWDFNEYLVEQATDFIYLERIASRIIPNKFRRLSGFDNLRKIAEIQRIPVEDVRMEKLQSGEYKIKNYFISDWMNWSSGVQKLPAYDKKDPFAYPNSVFYSKMPSFGSKYYGRPSTIGVANYLSLKLILLNNTTDFLVNAPFRYHIESPLDYWEAIRQQNDWNTTQLENYENEFFSEIDAFLTANDGRNAMKRFHTKYMLDSYGKQIGWKITPIEDNTDKRIDSNFKAFEQINENIIAATSLDPSLSNIQITGKLASGLDKLVAFNIHQLVNTPTPRQKILAAVNEAIKVNFWKDDFRPKLGFETIQMSTSTRDGGEDASK